jgi:hypothetical protein
MPLNCHKKCCLASRRLSTIELAAIAVIVLSVAVLAFVGFSIWAEP